MKKPNAALSTSRPVARLVAASVALCAAVVFCAPLDAQIASTPRPGHKWVERLPLADAKSEAGRKEVVAYEVAFSQMHSALGMKKALAYFLMPDYKWVRASGPVLGRAAAIEEKVQRVKKSLADYYAGKRKPEMLMDAKNRETYTLQKDTVTVMTHSSAFYLIPAWAAGAGQPQRPHRRHDVSVNRQVYKRTAKGLRLQEETEVSKKSYWDDKTASL